MLSWRAATGWPSTEARMLDVLAVLGEPPARDEDGATHSSIPGSRGPPRTADLAAERVALATRVDAVQMLGSSIIMPAQMPSTGLPDRTNSAAIGEPFARDPEP